MIKNLYLYSKNMLRHFSDDILGDDSLSDTRQFIKINKKYIQKKKIIFIFMDL